MKLAGVKLFFTFCLLANLLFAQTPYDVTKRNYKPKVQLLHDFGKIFTPQQQKSLEHELVAYSDSTSVQIVVVTFDKLDGYPIESLGNEIGENWGVGQKDKHNGIVIVIAKDDRKVTIRGGYGIQAKMPPTIEKLIIDREMIPEFKKGDYYQGVLNALDAIYLQLQGRYSNEASEDDLATGLGTIVLIFILVFVFLIIASKNDKNNRGNNGGGSLWRDIIFTSAGSSSWGKGSWGGSSSGGFGGFGGGGFGGGGASGSW